ncbi:hypothetical protein L209DRAFT_747211 [Thermothelomyces heterothallicus CBS 203.75]
MDSFKLLKHRITEMFHSLEQSIPSMPSLGGRGRSSAMKGTWEKLQIPPLPRSSHSADIVGGTLYIFGGEVEPRCPVDNDMHAITLPSSGAQADYYAIEAKPAKPAARPGAEKPVIPIVKEPEPEAADGEEPAKGAGAGAGTGTPDDRELSEVPLTTPSPEAGLGGDGGASGDSIISPASRPDLPDVPPPRVGHATAVIGHRIFLFGGRGGPDMTPLDEGGRVWVFDTRTHLWSFLDPRPAAANLPDIPRPAPRSYHSAAATPKPDAFSAKPPAHPHSNNNNNNKAEAWRDWALGTSAEAERTLGTPQRPVVGVLAERATDREDDGYGTFIIHGGCLAPSAPGAPTERASDVWAFDVRSRVWRRLPDAPGAPRGGAALAISRGRLYRFGGFNGASVAGLEAVTVGGGREYLVLMFGEREASGVGHAGAGRFWDDVWAFQVPPEDMSLASVADTALSVVGRKSGEGTWTRVRLGPHDEDEDDASADGPGPRGWIATAPMGELEENGIVVFGGLDERNRRLGDGWILRLD